MIKVLLAGLLALVASTRADAQGNLSTQGFGYPAGGLSVRAAGTAGALGEFDPLSAVNPATIAEWNSPVLFFQYEPEFRTVTNSGAIARTTTARFPLTGAAVPIGERLALGVTATSFLDRSATTLSERPETIGTSNVIARELFSALGGIDDIRLGAGYIVGKGLRVGLGGHVLTGENRISSILTFGDSSVFLPRHELTDLSYTGFAASGGFVWRPIKTIGIAASGRKGGNITMRSGDSLLATAKVPNRFAGGLEFSGIPGLTLIGRASRELWSSMQPLGSERLTSYDAWDISGGAEGAGPRLGSRVLQLRLGGRYRGLPFGAQGEQVKELSFGGGLGASFGLDRAGLDISLLRAIRFTGTYSARGPIDERAFILGIGLRVRP
jgi:hypothetical protein